MRGGSFSPGAPQAGSSSGEPVFSCCSAPRGVRGGSLRPAAAVESPSSPAARRHTAGPPEPARTRRQCPDRGWSPGSLTTASKQSIRADQTSTKPEILLHRCPLAYDHGSGMNHQNRHRNFSNIVLCVLTDSKAIAYIPERDKRAESFVCQPHSVFKHNKET